MTYLEDSLGNFSSFCRLSGRVPVEILDVEAEEAKLDGLGLADRQERGRGFVGDGDVLDAAGLHGRQREREAQE